MEVNFEILPHPRFSFLIHSVPSSNTQHGFQAVIVPPTVKPPEHFGLPNNTSSSKTLVFIQSCEPYNAFPKYNLARRETVCQLNLDEYLELLQYFANTHTSIKLKMMTDVKAISDNTEGINVTPYLQFFQSAILSYTHVLNKTCKLTTWIEQIALPETTHQSHQLYVRLKKDDHYFHIPDDALTELTLMPEAITFLQQFNLRVKSTLSTTSGSNSGKSPRKHTRKD